MLMRGIKRGNEEIERAAAAVARTHEEEKAEYFKREADFFRRDPPAVFQEDDDYEEDDSEDEGPKPAVDPAEVKRAYVDSAHTSAYAKASIEAAFAAGQAAGRREQLPPPPCKSCKLRKERNRIAAKESRLKKKAAQQHAVAAPVPQAELIRQGAAIAVQRQIGAELDAEDDKEVPPF
jgi:hypothetical protein